LIAALLTFVYLIGNGRYLLRDGDTFWHVAAGRWILDHGALPTADPFSHTMRGAPWLAHEWLSQVALASAQETGGWTLVVALCACAFALAVGMLTRALLRWLEPVYALLFAALAVFMFAGHALARPHMLALPLLVAWTIELARSRDEQRAPRLMFLPLMALWANVHGSFTLGIALAAAFACEAVWEARSHRARLILQLRSWSAFGALAIAAAMVTPSGPRGLWFTWQVLMQYTYALDFVGEWRSPNFHIFQPLELWLLGGLALVLHQGLRLPAVRLVLVLGLLHLALKHQRYVELLGLVAPLVFAAPFGAQWRARRGGQPQLHSADALFERLAAPAGARACALAFALCVTLVTWTARTQPLEFVAPMTPARALAAAQRAGATGNVLNTYEWGGWLAYRGIAPFIDGRTDMYGDAFLKQYREALELHAPGDFEALVDRYHVTWTLLAPGTPAAVLLDRLPGWRRVYADDTAVVHMREPS
jgi:hypothetical protein